MDPVNPYQSPAADISPIDDYGIDMLGMNYEQIRKLRNNSHSIRAIGGLWILGAGIIGISLFSNHRFLLLMNDSSGISYILILILLFIGIFSAIAVYAAWARPAWGRVVGIIACALTILNFPLGTLFGILGVIAFAGGGKLFGPQRITHSQISTLYKELTKRRRTG